MSAANRRLRLYALINLLQPVSGAPLQRALGVFGTFNLYVDLAWLERRGYIRGEFEETPRPRRRLYSTTGNVTFKQGGRIELNP